MIKTAYVASLFALPLILPSPLFAQTPAQQYLYIGSNGGGVLQYKVGDAAAPLDPECQMLCAGNDKGQIVYDPAGSYVYRTDPKRWEIYEFKRTSTGQLVPLHTVKVATSFTPNTVAVDPKGRFLILGQDDTGTLEGAGDVYLYSIGKDGQLTPQTDIPCSGLPSSIAIDPTADFAYVANGRWLQPSNITSFKIAPDGASMTEIQDEKALVGLNKGAISITPNGRYLVLNAGSVRSFAIGHDGSLSPGKQWSPSDGTQVNFVTTSTKANYAYVVTIPADTKVKDIVDDVVVLKIGAGGSLTQVSTTQMHSTPWATVTPSETEDALYSGRNDGHILRMALAPDGHVAAPVDLGNFAWPLNICVCSGGQGVYTAPGRLEPLSPSHIRTLPLPQQLAIDPRGRYLLLSASTVPENNNGHVTLYQIGPDGQLTGNNTNNNGQLSGRVPSKIVVDKEGHYAYVIDVDGNTQLPTLDVYKVSTDGASINQLPTPKAIDGLGVSDIAVSAPGNFLLLSTGQSIASFKIGADGGLIRDAAWKAPANETIESINVSSKSPLAFVTCERAAAAGSGCTIDAISLSISNSGGLAPVSKVSYHSSQWPGTVIDDAADGLFSYRDDGAILQTPISPTGVLSQRPQLLVCSPGTGDYQPASLLSTIPKGFVYILTGTGILQTYAVQPTGQLTTASQCSVGRGATALSVAPDGKTIAVAGGGSLSILGIDPDGLPNPHSTITAPTPEQNAAAIVWAADGAHIYVLAATDDTSSIVDFSFDRHALNQIDRVETSVGQPLGMFLLPNTKLLYVTGQAKNTVERFQILGNNSLEEIQPPTKDFGNGIQGPIVLGHDAANVYAPNGNNIKRYLLDSSGNFTPATSLYDCPEDDWWDYSARYTEACNFLAISHTGKYVAAANAQTNTISLFWSSPHGILTPIEIAEQCTMPLDNPQTTPQTNPGDPKCTFSSN